MRVVSDLAFEFWRLGHWSPTDVTNVGCSLALSCALDDHDCTLSLPLLTRVPPSAQQQQCLNAVHASAPWWTFEHHAHVLLTLAASDVSLFAAMAVSLSFAIDLAEPLMDAGALDPVAVVIVRHLGRPWMRRMSLDHDSNQLNRLTAMHPQAIGELRLIADAHDIDRASSVLRPIASQLMQARRRLAAPIGDKATLPASPLTTVAPSALAPHPSSAVPSLVAGTLLYGYLDRLQCVLLIIQQVLNTRPLIPTQTASSPTSPGQVVAAVQRSATPLSRNRNARVGSCRGSTGVQPGVGRRRPGMVTLSAGAGHRRWVGGFGFLEWKPNGAAKQRPTPDAEASSSQW